jgi:hypothetical protein
MEKDFSHPPEMTNKNSESVISKKERDLSELHHYQKVAAAICSLSKRAVSLRQAKKTREPACAELPRETFIGRTLTA